MASPSSSDPMRAAFIGLGKMGAPMAANLAQSGLVQLSVWNRSADKCAKIPNASVAASPAEAASDRSIIFTCVADDKALEEVAWSERGFLSSVQRGALVVEMSFVSVDVINRLQAALAEKGASLLTAAVFGRPEAAAAAKLTIVAGGAAGDLERARPLLERLGQAVLHVGGEPRHGAACKAVGNLLVAGVVEIFGEAINLGAAAGLDPDTLAELIARLFGTSGLNFRGYAERIARSDFANVGAALETGVKDLAIIRGLAASASCPTPLADLCANHLIGVLNATRAAGHGERSLDWTAVAAATRLAAGMPTGIPNPKP
eukprot:tig00000480_g1315.t1